MIVGITGGIGSGKTYICHRLQDMGYPTYLCDDEAKRLMLGDPTIRQQLQQLIGAEAYTPQGLNKPLIASYLFQNKAHAESINAIVHPVVRRDIRRWYSQQTSTLCFVESAILFEAQFDTEMDFTVLVHADEATRLSRAMLRDHADEQAIRSRMAQQTASLALHRADYLLNNGPQADPTPEIKKMIQYLKQQLCSKKS